MLLINDRRALSVALLAFLVVGTVALFEAHGSASRNADLSQALTRHQRRRALLAADITSMRHVLKNIPASAPVDLSRTAPLLIQWIEQSAAAHQVSITTLTVGDRGHQAKNHVAAYINPSPIQGLKKIPVTVSGQWTALSALKTWLRGLQRSSMSVSGVHISAHRYSVHLQILGSLPKQRVTQ